MTVTEAGVVPHSLFTRCIRALDVLQRVYMRCIAYLSPTKDCRTIFGAVVRCHTRQFVQRRIRFFGIFEHNLTYYTLGKLKEGDVYVDIGANIGYFSLLASRCVGPSGKVISVEADPTTFKDLTTNLKLNDCRNVFPKNVAATEVACRVDIERVAHNSGANTVVLGDGPGSIDGVPFREIVGSDIGRISFIKIDIEGSEEPILRSVLDALPELSHHLVVASEISANSAELVARFVAAGFRVYAIQNIYTIDYYLIRSYLAQYDEDEAVHMIAVHGYDARYRDYIFERSPRTPPV